MNKVFQGGVQKVVWNDRECDRHLQGDGHTVYRDAGWRYGGLFLFISHLRLAPTTVKESTYKEERDTHQ